MKKIYILILIAFIGTIANAQNYEWAKSINSGGNSNCLAIDASGNCYISGMFSSTVDFDPGPGIANLTSMGGGAYDYDIFIAEYDANGNYLWAKGIGGTGTDGSNCITVDASGNLYITGLFWGTVDFDPGTGIANLTSIGTQDIYFAKYDVNGNYIWARNIGSYTGGENCFSIALGNTGNCYITGIFQDSTDFDPGPGTVYLTTAVGNINMYFAKYDSNGNYLWVKQICSATNDYSYDIAVDGSGNSFITGTFKNTVDFDPGSGTANLIAVGNDDIFFAKYDANGNYLWAKSIGYYSVDEGHSIAVDGTGNCYIAGIFDGYPDFDPGSGTAHLQASGSEDVFFAKYDANGNYLLAKGIGNSHPEGVSNIVIDGSGNSYITGHFEGTVDFDPGIGIVNLSSAGLWDIYFAKYDGNGNYVWAHNLGSTGNDISNRIAIDNSGNCYLTGQFIDTVDFDPGPGTANLSSTSVNLYYAKYSQTTGIGENNVQPSINIFPNPTTDNLSIETTEKVIIDILNIEGQIIKTINTTDKQTTIDVSNLSSGVYIVKAKTERGVAVKKFIKE
ncbi:MAG: SBBP repeat-containing protein [Bacteroidota bacterium]